MEDTFGYKGGKGMALVLSEHNGWTMPPCSKMDAVCPTGESCTKSHRTDAERRCEGAQSLLDPGQKQPEDMHRKAKRWNALDKAFAQHSTEKCGKCIAIVGDEWQPESLAGLDKGERWAGRNFAPCKADGKKPLGCTDKLNGCVPANGVLRLQDTPKKLTPDQRQKLEQLLGQTERTELHAA